LIFIIICPLLLFISLLSIIFQGWPVFFSQERVGYKFRTFDIYKFRTMKKQLFGNKITVQNDNRINWWGKLLRKYKIDELLQIINIIKGDMVFVGPRPEIMEYVSTENNSYLDYIKPGLTGLSSIILRDEEKILYNLGGTTNYDSLRIVKNGIDDYYLKKKNLIFDLTLILITIISIFSESMANKIIFKYYFIDFDQELLKYIKDIV
jgi:lipopolysaccharide/colanic/teichoic acid biosynthesis glycosyltransferase